VSSSNVREARLATTSYDCDDAWISLAISPRLGRRPSAWREKIVLPSSSTSSTPGSAKLILGVRFNSRLISRLRRPASSRMVSHVKQRLISMVKLPPSRRLTTAATRRPILASVYGHGFAFSLAAPALFVPRPLSTPPAMPVTRLNATWPGPGSVKSNT
jgi:hypothetical protein